MRTLLISLFFAFSIAICNAQIAPPKQTDTLVITSVKYNYADIDKSNWPCEVIYKSTQDIRIGNQTFNIVKVKKIFEVIYFTVYDVNDPNKKAYNLEFTEKGDGTNVLSFSGYEFNCFKMARVVEESEGNEGDNTESEFESNCEANARLAGRSVKGTLPRPSYGVQADGKVVVKIWVDQNGNVTKAQAGVEGTTATNKTLWQASYKAAMGAHFNMDTYAPTLQEGTITYIFRMR